MISSNADDTSDVVSSERMYKLIDINECNPLYAMAERPNAMLVCSLLAGPKVPRYDMDFRATV